MQRRLAVVAVRIKKWYARSIFSAQRKSVSAKSSNVTPGKSHEDLMCVALAVASMIPRVHSATPLN